MPAELVSLVFGGRTRIWKGRELGENQGGQNNGFYKRFVFVLGLNKCPHRGRTRILCWEKNKVNKMMDLGKYVCWRERERERELGFNEESVMLSWRMNSLFDTMLYDLVAQMLLP